MKLAAQTATPIPASSPLPLTGPKALGLAAYRQGLYDKAAKDFLEAVNADPKDWQAPEELGDAYFKLNRWKKALEYYRDSLGLYPDNPTLNLWVGQLQREAETLTAGNAAATEPPNPAGTPKTPGEKTSFSSVKTWWRFEGGYSDSLLGEWKNSAEAFNRNLSLNGGRGSVFEGGNGLFLGLEVGFQACPFNGLAIGFHYLRTADYSANFNQPGTSSPTFEDETIQPGMTSFTLDDLWFLNDGNGRFFLGLGVGYYHATVHVEESYDFTSSGGGAANFVGDLDSDNVGFQASLGREWALNRNLAFSLFLRGRAVRISHFQGKVVNVDGTTAQFGLENGPDGTMDVDDVSYIDGKVEKYATLDFTGFDLMAAVVLYSY